MTEFFNDLVSSELRLRDKYQFEIKLDYSPARGRENTYIQEFFFFIPAALGVNKNTYTSENFYQDQTSLLRFKTPELTFQELQDPQNPRSPLGVLYDLLENSIPTEKEAVFLEELKLFANIFRSCLRDRVRLLITALHNHEESTADLFDRDLQHLCRDLEHIQPLFRRLLDQAWNLKTKHHSLYPHLSYVDEFFSLVMEHYCTGLLEETRRALGTLSSDHILCQIIVHEQHYREEKEYYSPLQLDGEEKKEYRYYRKGLLKKYISSALFLDTQRDRVAHRYSHAVGMFAAGLAMLVYMVLFVWGGTWFVFNSLPFIFATVAFYILKDRLKELIKYYFFRWFSWAFPDYHIDILNPQDRDSLGWMEQSFAWMHGGKLPLDIYEMRNQGFHTEMEAAERIETSFRYKTKVRLYKERIERGSRRHKLNNIFRFNISRFLLKASDAYVERAHYDPQTDRVSTVPFPKVYHINLIMRTRTYNEKGRCTDHLKKFRLVVDKEGIKRVERVN